MKNGSYKYMEAIGEVLERIVQEQMENIEDTSQVIAKSLMDGGVLNIFGSGHSHMVVEEAFHRAGGLVPINAMNEQYLSPFNPGRSGRLERLSGIADAILDFYKPLKGEVIIVISNSGINSVPVEMALGAKERGLKVVAITSVAHSKAAEARHESGKKLYEIADIAIDNCGVLGDALLEIDGIPAKLGPSSTMAGIAIINAISVRVAEIMQAKGVKPPVLLSQNMEGGGEHNAALMQQYAARLKWIS